MGLSASLLNPQRAHLPLLRCWRHEGGKDVVSLKMRKSETMRFLYVTVVGDLGVVRRRKSMVAVRLELQKQGWYDLVGQGADYKMTCCWFVSDITRGSSSKYSFLI